MFFRYEPYQRPSSSKRECRIRQAGSMLDPKFIIRAVVRWRGPLLLVEGIKRYPHEKISYRRCKGADGYYYPKSKTVEVLVNKQIDIRGLVFVTLHEVAHYIQDKTVPDFRNYDVYEHRFGYDANKFEVDANKFASDYQTSCLKHLESIGYI